MRKVLILDTSILCVWLEVPGKETCGSGQNSWKKSKVDELLKQEQKAGTTFVLPLASIVETGNHIAQASAQRYEKAQAFAQLMLNAADEKTPWAAFTEQSHLWDAEGLKRLATEWVELAVQSISIGDATIKTVAEFYARIGYQVEILTGDEGLKAFEPAPPTKRPKRRSQT